MKTPPGVYANEPWGRMNGLVGSRTTLRAGLLAVAPVQRLVGLKGSGRIWPERSAEAWNGVGCCPASRLSRRSPLRYRTHGRRSQSASPGPDGDSPSAMAAGRGGAAARDRVRRSLIMRSNVLRVLPGL